MNPGLSMNRVNTVLARGPSCGLTLQASNITSWHLNLVHLCVLLPAFDVRDQTMFIRWVDNEDGDREDDRSVPQAF